MKKAILPLIVLTSILASCGNAPSTVQAKQETSQKFNFTATTDEELRQMAVQNPDMKPMIESFIKESNEALAKNKINNISPQSIIIGGISSCRGDLDLANFGTSVKSTLETSCWGTGTRKVVASQVRLRLENTTTGQIVYADGNNPSGNNYLVQYLNNPSGTQIYCTKGWMLLTYADGTKAQSQTDGNYCDAY